MSLTDLQKSRIRFHLGLSSEGPAQYADLLTVDGLKPESVLQLVGTTFDFEFLGIPLAQTGSLLANCEQAWAQMTPAVIDDSLLVSQVGNVKLRGTELAKRQELYEFHCDSLAQVTNSPKLRATPKRQYYAK